MSRKLGAIQSASGLYRRSENYLTETEAWRESFLDALAFVLGAVWENSKIFARPGSEEVGFESLTHRDFANFAEGEGGRGAFSNQWSKDKAYIHVLEKVPYLKKRILVYSCWRALFYNSFRFYENLEHLRDVLLSEFKKAYLRYDHLVNIAGKTIQERKVGYDVFKGLFSTGIRTSHRGFVDTMNGDCRFLPEKQLSSSIAGMAGGSFRHFHVDCSLDAMDHLAEQGKFRPDMIITDPPFGFNTNEGGSSELEETFARLSSCMCRLAGDYGVIAVTLPAQSKNGKGIPFYETKEMLVHQMAESAAALGRKIVLRASILPDSEHFPRPAWRWSSERGVSRRAILFQVD